ncbi:MAG: phage baseplate plug family protein [Maricaulaceae bacterium]
MQELTILDFPHQSFSARLAGLRAEFDLHYNQLCDRWYLQVSLNDNCIGVFKVINDSRLMRECAPDSFGDIVAFSTFTPSSTQGPILGRNAFTGGYLKLYHADPQDTFLLGYNGY